MPLTIAAVQSPGAAYDALLALAEQIGQARYIVAQPTHTDATHLLGAWRNGACVGFLLLWLQVLGSDVGRPPILVAGRALREGYVEAFAVDPAWRRQGIGERLQEHAIAVCRAQGCYQIRSRSPITSHENYALKLKMGYAIQPSAENDSYYFIKTLAAS